jgi:outer membrane beta-barrel protein
MMTRSFPFLLVLALLGARGAEAQSAQTEAGDTSIIDREDRGPLKEKIPPVSGHFFLRQGRFELTPSLGLSFKDPFFSKYILSGALTYHASETFGIMLRGGYSLVTVSSAAQKCITTTNASGNSVSCTPPGMPILDGVAPGMILSVVELDAQWAPLYGKLSLISEAVGHFDLYAIVGPAAVLYGGPRTAGAIVNSPAWTVGADVGVGMRFFLNHWVTLKLELRDLIYAENVADSPGSQSTASSLRNQLIFDLGVSFFFPVHVEEG